MNKSTDIFNLEKWWVKRVTLIVAALVLAGCQSQAIQSTATPTPTEIPATATLMPTNTAEPTATATELVLPDNAVEIVGGGYAYVENGKAMLLGKNNITKEIKDLSTEVIFNNTKDASDVVYALHKEAFDNQNLADWYPGNLGSDQLYKYAVEDSVGATFDAGEGGFEVGAVPLEFAKVKLPIADTKFTSMGVMFVNIYGSHEPVEVPLGIFDGTGKYYNMLEIANRYSPEKTISGTPEENINLKDKSWSEMTAMFSSSEVVYFMAVLKLLPENMIDYDYQRDGYKVTPENDWYATWHARLDPDVIDCRAALVKYQMDNQTAAGNLYFEGEFAKETGTIIAGIKDRLSPGYEPFFVPFLGGMRFLGN